MGWLCQHARNRGLGGDLEDARPLLVLQHTFDANLAPLASEQQLHPQVGSPIDRPWRWAYIRTVIAVQGEMPMSATSSCPGAS